MQAEERPKKSIKWLCPCAYRKFSQDNKNAILFQKHSISNSKHKNKVIFQLSSFGIAQLLHPTICVWLHTAKKYSVL